MWKSVLAGVTGSSHEKRDQPCQDYGNYLFLDSERSIIAGAIADGMGSAKHSDKGSKLAVETALSFLKSLNIDCLEVFLEEDARKTFSWLVDNVQTKLKKEAKDKEYSLHDLACTLLVFVATPNYIMAMQIGDGFIVIGSAKNEEYTLLFQPHQDGAIDVTTSITSSSAINEMQVCFVNDVCDFVCSGTDGLEYIALKFPRITDCQPKPKFFEPTRNLVISTEEKEAKEKIEKFFLSNKVRQKSDDDKTLLVCVRPDVVNSESSIDKFDTGKAPNSDSDNPRDSDDTGKRVSEDDLSSESGKDTSSKQEIKFFAEQINLSQNTNSPLGSSTSNATPKVESSNSSDETNMVPVNDANTPVTPVSETIEEEAAETETEINTSKKDVSKGLSITANILTIPLIFFLFYKLKQPVIPIYAIPNLKIPNTEKWVIISGDSLNKNKMIFEVKENDFAPVSRSPIDAKNPQFVSVATLKPNTYSYRETKPFNDQKQLVRIENSPLSFSAWAIASTDHLNPREMSFTLKQDDLRVIYQGSWTPSNKLDSQYRLGELLPGTYRYTEAKLFDAKNPGYKRRWVKIQIKKP